MSPYLTVFVPAYNEQANLEANVQAIWSKLTELGVDGEILIVDDGSDDGTPEIADCLNRENPSVRVVHHSQNLGVGRAFRSAVSEARGEWLILIPADLAMDLNELTTYLNHSNEADVVVGLRSDRSDYTFLRKIVSLTNILAVRLLFGMKLRQFQYISMYRLALLRQMEIQYWMSAFFLAEILIKARDLGKRLVEVEICYAPRVSGKASGAKMKLILKTMVDMIAYRIKRTLKHYQRW